MGRAFAPKVLVALQSSSFCLQHAQKLNHEKDLAIIALFWIKHSFEVYPRSMESLVTRSLSLLWTTQNVYPDRERTHSANELCSTCRPSSVSHFLEVAELWFIAPRNGRRPSVRFDEAVQLQALWVHHPLQNTKVCVDCALTEPTTLL